MTKHQIDSVADIQASNFLLYPADKSPEQPVWQNVTKKYKIRKRKYCTLRRVKDRERNCYIIWERPQCTQCWVATSTIGLKVSRADSSKLLLPLEVASMQGSEIQRWVTKSLEETRQTLQESVAKRVLETKVTRLKSAIVATRGTVHGCNVTTNNQLTYSSCCPPHLHWKSKRHLTLLL